MSRSERRKSRRREILEHFSFFVSLPERNPCRLQVQDVSKGGFAFNTEGDSFLSENEETEIQFHLNQSLFIRMKCRIVRVSQISDGYRVGVELKEPESPSKKAFLSLIQLVDSLERIESV